MTRQELAARIEHTLLKAEVTIADIDQVCAEAVEYGFAGVCVNPLWVGHCARRLEGTPIRVVTVAGFPLGASRTEVKVDEARRAVEDGAVEVDMVVRVGALREGDLAAVRDDIAAVADAVHAAGPECLLKVILETAALTSDQIIAGCRCVAEAQADYVKTSTGFHPGGGATIDAVQLLHKHIVPLKVKAAGGIRDLATAQAMIQAGADRLGCSAGVVIIHQLND